VYYTEPKAHWVEDPLNRLWHDPITGEAIAVNLLDSAADKRAYIPTGFFFERAFQIQPDPLSLDSGIRLVDIPDWAFATAESAQWIAELLGAEMPELNYARVVAGRQLSRFPYVTIGPDGNGTPLLPRSILLSSTHGGSIIVNAGLIAFQLARYFSVDPATDKVRPSWELTLRDLVDELRDELEHSAEEGIGQMPALLPGNEKFAVGRA